MASQNSGAPKSDIEIARAATMQPITDLARARLGLEAGALEPYGHFKAKGSLEGFERNKEKPDGKLILVTAITPPPAGEGRTDTPARLGGGLRRLGDEERVCFRAS